MPKKHFIENSLVLNNSVIRAHERCNEIFRSTVNDDTRIYTFKNACLVLYPHCFCCISSSLLPQKAFKVFAAASLLCDHLTIPYHAQRREACFL